MSQSDDISSLYEVVKSLGIIILFILEIYALVAIVAFSLYMVYWGIRYMVIPLFCIQNTVVPERRDNEREQRRNDGRRNDDDERIQELRRNYEERIRQQFNEHENNELRRESIVMFGSILTNEMCSICYTNYIIGDQLTTLNCNHYFHTQCIDPWLAQHNTCPLCREVV